MISVCIATYNGEKLIQEQLQSILKQLQSDDEVVVSDDGSTDETLTKIRALNDARIRIFLNDKKHGFTHNFENAIKQSKGEVIFLSDQDDVWPDNKVNRFLSIMQKGYLVISDAWVCNEDLIPEYKLSSFRSFKSTFLANLYKGMFLGSTMAFTRESLAYFLPIPNVLGHDMWFALLAALDGKLIYLDEPLLFYRKHSGSVTASGKRSHNTLSFKIKYRINFLFRTVTRYITYRLTNG